MDQVNNDGQSPEPEGRKPEPDWVGPLNSELPPPERSPDNERLIRGLGDSIRHFLQDANRKQRGVNKAMEDVSLWTRRLNHPMEDARIANNLLRSHSGESDPRLDQVRSYLGKINSRVENQLRSLQGLVGENELSRLLRQQDQRWLKESGVEEFVNELIAVADEPDEEIRKTQLKRLYGITSPLRKDIPHEASKQRARQKRYNEETASNRFVILRTASGAEDLARELHRKFPQLSSRLRFNIEQMKTGLHGRFKVILQLLDSMPLSYKSISYAAQGLGMNINEVFAHLDQQEALERDIDNLDPQDEQG